MASKRPLSLRRRVGFSIVSLVLLLGLVEGVATLLEAPDPPAPDLLAEDPEWLVHAREGVKQNFYVTDPHVMWRPRPGFRQEPRNAGMYGENPLVLNEWGHRSPPMSQQKPEGVKRVMVLGGSHPFGMWVETPEVYSSVLDELLGERAPGKWQVLNSASPGHTTFQGRMLLEHQSWKFQPDIVVFDLGMNDELPLSLSYSAPDHEVVAAARVGKLASLAGSSAAYRALRKVLSPVAGRSAATMRVPHAQRVENLTAAAELGKEHGWKVLYVAQVGVESFKGPGVSRCTYRPSDDGFEPMVDLCAVFSKLGAEAGTHFVDPIHASGSGHRIIGEAVYARLDELGWLD
jgi:lysophospholipase L1-like esterase